MARRTGIWAFVLDAAIFIGLEIAALALLYNRGTVQNSWLLKGINNVNSVVWGLGENIGGYFRLKKDNKELAMENFRLSQALLRYESAERDLSLGDGSLIGGFRYIPCTLTKHSSNKQHNYFILDKGADDGVCNGSGIVTTRGVLGVVSAVGRRYSLATSLLNPDMVVSARIGREGSVGPLSWNGISRRGAILKEIPHNSPFEKGDTVFTSGFSSLFPPDIPLGVLGDSKIINGASYEIEVSLFEDLGGRRYASVTVNDDRQEITELEQTLQ